MVQKPAEMKSISAAPRGMTPPRRGIYLEIAFPARPPSDRAHGKRERRGTRQHHDHDAVEHGITLERDRKESRRRHAIESANEPRHGDKWLPRLDCENQASGKPAAENNPKDRVICYPTGKPQRQAFEGAAHVGGRCGRSAVSGFRSFGLISNAMVARFRSRPRSTTKVYCTGWPDGTER